MAFVKFRDGWSGPGSQAANWMLGADQPAIGQRLRDGVRTERNGDFVNVYQGSQATDGYYAIGTTPAGSRIVGSANGLAFSDRGDAPAHGGFTTSSLGYYGKGLGVVVFSKATCSYTNFDGKTCAGVSIDYQRTPNGRKLTDYFSTYTYIPFGQAYTSDSVPAGGYIGAPGADTFCVFYSISLMVGDQMVQAVIRDDGAGTQAVTPTLYLNNQLGWYADTTIVAPGTLVKMDRYIRPTYSGSSVDITQCPGLYFSFTTDAGTTWHPCSGTGMWDAELATLLALPNDPSAAAAKFNTGISYSQCYIAPLTRRYAVIQAIVPYIDGTGNVKGRVKLGLLDVAAGCTMTEIDTLFDGELEDCAMLAGWPPFPVPGGVLVPLRDISAGRDNAYDKPLNIKFTANGTDYVDWAKSPFISLYTGLFSAPDAKTLVCPMWDGKYSAYLSKDWGKTWKRGGVIAANGVAPPIPAGGSSPLASNLPEFTLITCLRRNNAAAPAFPATPWITDARYSDPPPL